MTPKRRWFSVDTKSFTIEEVGVGTKTKVVITERRRGRTSWIQFGTEGARTLLRCVVSLRSVAVKNYEGLGWCENGRRYRLEMKENFYGRFMLCSTTDLDGRRHRLLFPEGNGLINGWSMLEEVLQDLGHKGERGERREVTKISTSNKVENKKEVPHPATTNDIRFPGRKRQETIWLDTSENCSKGILGLLKYGVVGSWKILPGTAQSLVEVEAWAKRVWKLEGRIAINPLNQNLFFMGFELAEEARWVMKNGCRNCRGGELQLEWWTPYSGCNRARDQENEVWIRVVGLPLHLWSGEILKKVGDNCGGFVAMDEGTTSKTELHWARILVKLKCNERPASVNLLAGARSYELQIWWEIRPSVAEVFPQSSRISAGPADPGEEDVRDARAIGRVKAGREARSHDYQGGQSKVCSRTTLGSGMADSRLSNSQTRGENFQEGSEADLQFQNDVGIGEKKGKPKYPSCLDWSVESNGLNLEDVSAHSCGQIQGVTPGPRYEIKGVKSNNPTKRSYLANLRGNCKGKIGEKTGAVYLRCSGPKEREVPANAEKGSQETVSIQGREGSGEGDEGRKYCSPINVSTSGKAMEKFSYGADLVCDGEKDGSSLAVVVSSGNVLRADVQAGEKPKNSPRELGMKFAWLRAEEERKVGIRDGRSVLSVGEGRGNIDGSSGREQSYRRDAQPVKSSGSEQSLGEDRGSGQVLIPGLGPCRVLGSTADLGQNPRATQYPVYINRAQFNGFNLHEPTRFKAQTKILTTGMSQDLFISSTETAERLEPISWFSEAEHEGNVSSYGEEDELRKVSAQAEKHNLTTRYDDNLITQFSSTPISVFGRPLLSGGFSGRGDSGMEMALPLRVVAADGREWGSVSPGGISDVGVETGAVGQRKEVQCVAPENRNHGSWESSCLIKFSEFLGFPTTGFEKEIVNLLSNLVESQKLRKEKGSMTVTKSERELRRLRSTINYDGKKINKGVGRDRENLLLKLK